MPSDKDSRHELEERLVEMGAAVRYDDRQLVVRLPPNITMEEARRYMNDLIMSMELTLTMIHLLDVMGGDVNVFERETFVR